MTYNDNNAKYAEFLECSGNIEQTKILGTIDNTSTLVLIDVFAGSTPAVKDLEFGNVRVNLTPLNSATCVLFSGGSNVAVGSINKPEPAIVALTNIDGSTTCNNISVKCYETGKYNSVGDNDHTIEVGEPNVIVFKEPITAGRVVTLPKRYSPSDVYQGLTYKIIKRAEATGLFDITIKSDTGQTLHTIPNSEQSGFVTLEYDRFSFFIANKGSLS